MTNQQHNKGGPPTPGKWQVDHFTIRMCHAEYIDSMEDSTQPLAYKKQYEVKYDVELFFPGDVVSMRMHVLVNGDGSLPGYRIACTVQTDYSLLSQTPIHHKLLSQHIVFPFDLGNQFFLGGQFQQILAHKELLVAVGYGIFH